MRTTTPGLWELVLERTHIDPHDLAAAIEQEAGRDDLDFRTRLLIRDGVNALERHWGAERHASWLASSPARARIDPITRAELGEPGFPSLAYSVMETTKPNIVLQFLRELGIDTNVPAHVVIGGSISLILTGLLDRRTEDIDVVDEVPLELRTRHDLLARLSSRYRLALTHFQSHYLPTGWEGRIRSLDTYGKLQVFLVDPYDVFLSKLFSRRDKDLDDLRMVAPRLDRAILEIRYRDTTASLRSEQQLHEAAERNWYIVFGDKLPG